MGGAETSPSPRSQDILAKYLSAYARARQMHDFERPWGLVDDPLDCLWVRLVEVLSRNPERLDRLVNEELNAEERERIAAALTPLIFALPIREFPSEVRVIRTGSRLQLLLRRFAHTQAEAQPPALPDGRRHEDSSLGHLPASLTGCFALHLRKALRFPEGQNRHVALVSSCGRRRRVQVTLLAQGRGVLIRFLERLPSPTEQEH